MRRRRRPPGKPGGLSFFALGASGVLVRPAAKAVPLQQAAGAGWIQYGPAQVTSSMKSFFDGKGWLAHVIPADRFLFVKKFPEI